MDDREDDNNDNETDRRRSSTATVDLVLAQVERQYQEEKQQQQQQQVTNELNQKEKNYDDDEKQITKKAAAAAQVPDKLVQVGQVVGMTEDIVTKKGMDSEVETIDTNNGTAITTTTTLPGAFPQRGVDASLVEEQQERQQPQRHANEEEGETQIAALDGETDETNPNDHNNSGRNDDLHYNHQHRSSEFLITATLVEENDDLAAAAVPPTALVTPAVTVAATQIRAIDSTGRILGYEEDGDSHDDEEKGGTHEPQASSDPEQQRSFPDAAARSLSSSQSLSADKNQKMKKWWMSKNPKHQMLWVVATISLLVLLVVLVPLAIVQPWSNGGSSGNDKSHDSNNDVQTTQQGDDKTSLFSSPPSTQPSLSVSPSLAPSNRPTHTHQPSESPSLIPTQSLSPSVSPSLVPTQSISPSVAPSLSDWFDEHIVEGQSHVAFAAVHAKLESECLASGNVSSSLLEISCQAGIGNDVDPQLLVLNTTSSTSGGDLVCTRQHPDVFVCEAEDDDSPSDDKDWVVLVVCTSATHSQFHIHTELTEQTLEECGRFNERPPFLNATVIYTASARHVVTLGEYCFWPNSTGTDFLFMDDATFCDDPIHATSANGKPYCQVEAGCEAPWTCDESAICQGNASCGPMTLPRVGATYPVVQECATLTGLDFHRRRPTLDYGQMLRTAATQFSFNFGLPLPVLSP